MYFGSFKSFLLNLYESYVLILKFGFVLFRRFKSACQLVSIARSHGQLDDEHFYTLYGLYKQARFGDYEDYGSYFTNHASDKTELWKKLRGMPPKEALIEYIRYANQVLPTLKESDDLESNVGSFSSIMIMDSNGETFEHDDFFMSVSEGDFDLVQSMVEKQPALVEVKSPEGLTALHLAVDRGYLDIVVFLLDSGSDINAVDDNGDSPLHVALESEQDEIVKILLGRGGNPEQRNYEGVSPMDLINLSNM